MSEADLPPPEFSEVDGDGNSVRVILRNEFEHRKSFIDAEVEVPISAELYKKLSDRERSIVNYLAEHNIINVTEAANILGVQWRTAKKALESLISKEICEYLPAKRGQKAHNPSQKIRLKV
jgi:predicted HTH transcriptional regulator